MMVKDHYQLSMCIVVYVFNKSMIPVGNRGWDNAVQLEGEFFEETERKNAPE
jgi:hypothetical protein